MTHSRFLSLRNIALGAMLSVALIGSQGCVYRLTIQQGNFLQAKDMDRVAVGMTRVQVRAVLGTPMVADPFQTDRWDYVYFAKGGVLKEPYQRQFTIFFEDDKVVRIDRSDAKQPDAPSMETIPDAKPAVTDAKPAASN